MTDDENHPEMARAQQDLLGGLAKIFVPGSVLTQSKLDDMFKCVGDHRAHWRGRGVDFPALVAVVVPRLGIVDLKRADVDVASVRQSIVNFVRFTPAATMEEVVAAFRAAYPDLRPDDVLSEQQRADAANKSAVERAAQRAVEAAREVGLDETEAANVDTLQ